MSIPPNPNTPGRDQAALGRGSNAFPDSVWCFPGSVDRPLLQEMTCPSRQGRQTKPREASWARLLPNPEGRQQEKGRGGRKSVDRA